MMTLEGFEPAHSAVLAMDFQPSIMKSVPDPCSLLSNTRSAIAAIRHAGGRAAYVRVAFQSAELRAFPEHSAMGARVRAAGLDMHADSPATAIHASIAPHVGEIAVRKTRVGAFSTTSLDLQLKKADVDTLVLAGVHTSGVILSTVREAHDLDYRVIVLSDCCADPDVEVHEFLLGRIFPKQATICTAAELGQLLLCNPNQ